MPQFQKRYVHFMWDDKLQGKEVFFANTVEQLSKLVLENQDKRKVFSSGNKAAPFSINGDPFCNKWMFIYYDPNYEFKVAFEQGKKIECKRKGDAWEDWNYTPDPEWLDDYEYRIKPEESKPVTNRELARWLSQGNGEYKTYEDSDLSTYNHYYYYYKDCEADAPVKIPYVRKWEDTHWHEPTREYMGLEE